MPKTICIIGAFDTKGEDHAFVREEILKRGHQTLMVNVGVLGSTSLFPVDCESGDVAKAGGINLADLRSTRDKSAAMKAFDEAAPKLVLQLFKDRKIDGIIGMGGLRRLCDHRIGDARFADRRSKGSGVDRGVRRCFLLRARKRYYDDAIDRGCCRIESHFAADLFACCRSDLRNG